MSDVAVAYGPLGSGSAFGGPASSASLTSSSIASRITRSVSSSRWACSSFESARNSGHSVRSWNVFGARSCTVLRRRPGSRYSVPSERLSSHD